MSANVIQLICLALSVGWLVVAIRRDEPGFHACSAVFLAASFVIGALS